jgi:hypothetical protein
MSRGGDRRFTFEIGTLKTDQQRSNAPMDWKLEAVVIPVSDVARAKQFYVDKLGFNLDVDHQPSDAFRVVQVTPPGSACSVTFGVGVSTVPPGTFCLSATL